MCLFRVAIFLVSVPSMLRSNCITSVMSQRLDMELYLRRETVDGRVDRSFNMAKSGTAPLQFVSVQRLELQAATITVRMHRLILKEIDLAMLPSFFWTDLKITLQYINNETHRFKTYV